MTNPTIKFINIKDIAEDFKSKAGQFLKEFKEEFGCKDKDIKFKYYSYNNLIIFEIISGEYKFKYIENYDDYISYEWYKNEEEHRENKPACIYLDKDGSREEVYYKEGEKHNINGQALVMYNKNDKIEYKEYCVNGVLHSLNGPALVMYNDKDEIIYKEYWVNGKEIEIPENISDEKMIKFLKIKAHV